MENNYIDITSSEDEWKSWRGSWSVQPLCEPPEAPYTHERAIGEDEAPSNFETPYEELSQFLQ